MWISSLLRQKSISSSRSFKIDLRNMISWCHLPKGRIGSFRHLMACIFSGILEIGRFSSDLPAAIGPTATAAAGSGLPPAGRQRHGVHRPGAGADTASHGHPSPHAPKRRMIPSRPMGPPGTSGGPAPGHNSGEVVFASSAGSAAAAGFATGPREIDPIGRIPRRDLPELQTGKETIRIGCWDTAGSRQTGRYPWRDDTSPRGEATVRGPGDPLLTKRLIRGGQSRKKAYARRRRS